MTTTAEKIKDPANIQCPVCGYYCLGKGGAGCIDKPSLQNKPKPPSDHEPLECWVWFKPSNPKAATYVHLSQDEALMHELFMEHEGWSLYPLREVTPQDEQDRKDAARYRKAKEAVERSSHLWTRMLQHSVDQWDEIIDKAMEEKT